MSERKFYCFGEETKNGFLFLLVADAFDFVAAERAKLEIFSATPAHASDAIFAHHFFAKSASMRDGGRRMPRAKQRAIFEHNGRRFENGDFDFRNGDVYISRFDENFNVAGGEVLAGHKARFANRFAIDKSSVGGFAVAQDELAAVQFEFTMETGNGGMFDLQIGVGTSP